MYRHPTLQTEYLHYLIQTQKPVMLYFKNGHRLRGTITGMTEEVIFFRQGMTEFFYKQHINAVMPLAASHIKV